MEQRKRYNIWDLLGDVGGFNDGLFLLGSLLVSTYARLHFKKDYLDGTQMENPENQHLRNFENSDRFNALLGVMENK